MLESVLHSLLVVVAAGIVAVALFRRVAGGYPEPPSGLAVLHRGEVAFIEAAAEVLFPDGGRLPVSGLDARLALYVDRHLSVLPRIQRLQIRALLLLFEHVPAVIAAAAPGGRGRFSSLPAASRSEVLERIADHRDLRVRILFTALRAVLALGYLGHPANLRALGLAPFEIEPAVSDAELLFPRVGALPMSIRSSEADRTGPRSPLDPQGPRHRAYLGSSRDAR